MGILRVLSRQGDDRVAWDVERVAVGDPEATAAVNEAERIFREQQARGAAALIVEPDSLPVRIDQFDPLAKQILIIPRVVGG